MVSPALSGPVDNPGLLGAIGGIFAGIVALLGVFGAGVKWCCGAADRRARSRSAKLDKWSAELGDREATLDRAIAGRLAELEAKVPRLERLERLVERWRLAFRLVAGELARVSPRSPALIQAQAVLAEDFDALDQVTPDDMAEQLDRLGEIE